MNRFAIACLIALPIFSLAGCSKPEVVEEKVKAVREQSANAQSVTDDSDKMLTAREKVLQEYAVVLQDDDERQRVLDMDLATVKERVARSSDFGQDLFLLPYWCSEHPDEILPWLIEHLDDATFVGLKNTADLIIWERIESGDLQFYGHGGVSADDLFTVAGRASWLLKKMTGENFGTVKPRSTAKELADLKQKWSLWRRGTR